MACTIPRPFTDAHHAHERVAFRRAGHNQIRRMFSPTTWLVASAATLIVDVGSYTGVDLIAFMKHAGHAADNITVHTFEPVLETRIVLQSNVHNYSQIHVHPYGLADISRAMCITGSGDAATLQPIPATRTMHRCSPERRARVVQAWRAFRALNRPIDLLQLNCEGCELQVLNSLLKQPTTPHIIRSIEVQFHRGAVSESAYCSIDARLRRLGYTLDYRFAYVWERWTRLNSQQHVHVGLGSWA